MRQFHGSSAYDSVCETETRMLDAPFRIRASVRYPGWSSSPFESSAKIGILIFHDRINP
jgi:hypothetical protein